MALLRFRLPAWRCLAVTAATALLAVTQALVAPQAATAVEPGAGSTKDRGCASADGEALRYIVVFDESTPAKRAKREIRKACGKLTVYYDAIAVGVATSRDERFGERIGADRAFSAQAHRADGAARADSERLKVTPTVATTVPGGDRGGEQWDMEMINAGAARAAAGGGHRVVVGVLDSGIDAAHPELTDAVDPGVSAGCLTGKPDTAKRAWLPTTSVHGTHVAGTIAAADDGSGVVGVAPEVRLASIKVIGDRGEVDPEAAICGLMWAGRHRMPVANSSFFVDAGSTSCDSDDEYGVVREAVRRATQYASDAGTLNVAAVTNESVSLTRVSEASGSPRGGDGCQALPASLPSVLAVSAVDSDGVKSGYSSYGLGVVSLAAPGGDDGECVLSTVPDGFSDTCGTSMAAPHVAGVAALLAARNPDAGPEQLRSSLTSTATQTACPADYDRAGDGHQDAYCTGYRGYNGFYGHGVVNALAAVESIVDAGATVIEPRKRAKKPSKPDDLERTAVADQPAEPEPAPDLSPLRLRLNLGSLLGR